MNDSIRRSSAVSFGHAAQGWAVEFNFAGFACRSLTVESREEAEMIKTSIEAKDGTTRVEVVRDA